MRKPPIRHTVSRHKRNGKWVESFERGSGSRRTKKVVVGSEKLIKRRTTHTGGVIVEDGTVLKPLLGFPAMNAPYPIATNEYKAIKDLEDLSHIPKGATKIIVDGIPHMRRENLRIFTEDDYKSLGNKHLISIENTIWEAQRRGWDIGDWIQLGQSKKSPYEIVIYDWSTARKADKYSNPDLYITRLWKDAGHERYAKAREWAIVERSMERINQIKLGTRIPYQYTYMSFSRPVSWMWAELPEDTLIKQVKIDESWKPFSLIHTVEPLPQEKIKSYELRPTKYDVPKKEIAENESES